VATACIADAEVRASSLTRAMVITGAGARLAARATFSVGHGRGYVASESAACLMAIRELPRKRL
jgi:hypothetical protein